jgi:hypothetical protein
VQSPVLLFWQAVVLWESFWVRLNSLTQTFLEEKLCRREALHVGNFELTTHMTSVERAQPPKIIEGARACKL